MNWGSAIHRPMVVRAVISLLLGAAALGLFVPEPDQPPAA